MSDWEIASDQNIEQAPVSDWEVVHNPNNDPVSQQDSSYGASLLKAVPRIGEDIMRSGMGALKSIPGYYQAAKTEVPGVFNTIRNNPLSAGKQAVAGMAETGQNVFNTPHNIINYLSQRLHLVPEDINKIVQMSRMPDSSQQINQTFGEPNQPGEKLIRGAFRNMETLIPAAKFGASAIRSAGNAVRPINPEKVARSIQKSHDTLNTEAGDIFSDVGKKAYQRNVSMVPLRQDLVSDIADHPLIPKTAKMKEVLNKAYSGDYNGLRDLQSELWQRATKASRSPLVSEANAAEELFDLRDEVNKSISNHFHRTGHGDLAHSLEMGREKYKLLKDTYYSRKTPNAIKNLVDSENRKMPKNIMNVLSQESKPMSRIKKENPYAARKSEQYESKQNAINTLKNLGLGGAVVGGLSGLGYGAKKGYDYLTGE